MKERERIAEEMRWRRRVDGDKKAEREEGAKRSWLEESEERIVQKHWDKENAAKHKEEKTCSVLIVR